MLAAHLDVEARRLAAQLGHEGGMAATQNRSLAVIVTRPSMASLVPAAARPRRMAAVPMRRACSSRRSPLGVITRPRPTRSNSTTPSSRSSAAICRPTVGCVVPRARAAADSDPSSAVSRKALMRFQSKCSSG